MELGEQELEKMGPTRVMRLDAIIQAIVIGLVLGGGVFVATIWLVLKGGNVVGPHLVLLGQFFIGYEVTFLGSLVGFGYGFVVGFVVGFFIAKIYNLLADWREHKSPVAPRSVQRAPDPENGQARGALNKQIGYSEIRPSSNGRDHAQAGSKHG